MGLLWGFFGSCAAVGSGVSRCMACCCEIFATPPRPSLLPARTGCRGRKGRGCPDFGEDGEDVGWVHAGGAYGDLDAGAAGVQPDAFGERARFFGAVAARAGRCEKAGAAVFHGGASARGAAPVVAPHGSRPRAGSTGGGVGVAAAVAVAEGVRLGLRVHGMFLIQSMMVRQGEFSGRPIAGLGGFDGWPCGTWPLSGLRPKQTRNHELRLLNSGDSVRELAALCGQSWAC